MADLTITEANVQHSAAADIRHGIAAEAITAGEVIYQNSSTQMALADNNVDAATAAIAGVAASSAAGAGQPISWAVSDPAFVIGATVEVGEAYAVSATAGGIAPILDLAASAYFSLVGIGVSTTEIWLKPIATGAQHA